MSTSSYSIKDIEQLTGIKAHTIRIWEQRYHLLSPSRTDSNIRNYTSDDLRLMLNIAALNNHGFKISKIAQMTGEEINQKVWEMVDATQSFPDQISALTVAMIDLDHDKFEKTVSLIMQKQGLEKMMLNIIFPFLQRIGYLWQIQAISPAQEHFITHLIRLKLMVAIDGLYGVQRNSPRKYMLFLPEGEMHEISLLFSCYAVMARGHKAIYLGQNLPISDAASAYAVYKPDFVLSVFTSSPTFDQAHAYIENLNQQLSNAPMLLAGSQVSNHPTPFPKNVKVLHHFNDLIQHLEE